MPDDEGRKRGGNHPAVRLVSGWLPAALIALATIAAYADSLHGPFIFDDLFDIVENPSIRRLWPLSSVFAIPSAGETVLHPRPVGNLTLAINYAVGGLETFPYHLTNLAIHLLASLTLFGIARRTLELPGPAGFPGRAATPMAAAIALLWSLHPIQTHAVTYITQRYECLMGLFYLLALYALIRSAASPRQRSWEAAAVAATLVAMGCKEVAVSAPLCLLLYDRAFLSGSFREAWARRYAMYLALMGVWALFLVVQVFSAGRGSWAGYAIKVLWTDYAKTQPAVILHYLRLSLWPQPLVLDYYWQPARGLGEVLPAAAVVGGLVAASAVLLVQRPREGFLGAWFFLILAPTSSVLPINDLAFLHRMYLPSIAVVTAVVLGAHAVGQAVVRRQWLSKTGAAVVGVAAVAVAAAALGAATRARNADFGSVLSIWADTAAKAPHNPRAQVSLGLARAARGETMIAIAHYRKALALFPDYPKAHFNLGIALVSLGRTEEAEGHFREAIRLEPDSAATYNNLGNLVSGRGRTKEAVEFYETALKLKPDYADVHNNLGIAIAATGRIDEGIAHLQEALRLRPGKPEYLQNLALARSLASRTTGQGVPADATGRGRGRKQ